MEVESKEALTTSFEVEISKLFSEVIEILNSYPGSESDDFDIRIEKLKLLILLISGLFDAERMVWRLPFPGKRCFTIGVTEHQ